MPPTPHERLKPKISEKTPKIQEYFQHFPPLSRNILENLFFLKLANSIRFHEFFYSGSLQMNDKYSYFLNELIMFEHFSAFHDSHNGSLQVHFSILLHCMMCLFDLLRRFFLNSSSDSEFSSLISVLHI